MKITLLEIILSAICGLPFNTILVILSLYNILYNTMLSVIGYTFQKHFFLFRVYREGRACYGSSIIFYSFQANQRQETEKFRFLEQLYIGLLLFNTQISL